MGIGINTEGLFGTNPFDPKAPTPRPGQQGSYIDQLIRGLETPKENPLADIGSLLGSFSQGRKADRVVEGNFMGDFDSMMLGHEADRNRLALDAQQGRNLNEADAMRKLQQTSYLMGGGSNYAPATIQMGGKDVTLPSFAGIAPRPVSETEKAGAASLQGQVMGRLQPGGSVMPQWNHQVADPATYAKPGMLEQIGSYGATGAGILGMLGNFFGPGGGEGGGGSLSNVPGLGKAGGAIGNFMQSGLGKGLGAAGGAAAGIAGLVANKGLASNVASGAGAGASIGSVVPGIGTAIGAGVGAGVGALRSAFGGGPSEQEIAGRQTAQQSRQMITSGATPQQMQEAQKAGWSNPQDALTMIVLRDKITAAGGTPEQANHLMAQLYQAEKGGPQAVEQILQQIMKSVQPQQASTVSPTNPAMNPPKAF
jgi:hypothetical protein